jgi:hypothetical protein
MRKFSAGLAFVASLFLILSVFAIAAFGQDSTNLENSQTGKTVAPPAQTSVPEGKNELSVQGGFAPDIPRVFGGSRRSTFGFVALRYGRVLNDSETVAVKYTVDFIPLAILNYDQHPIVQTGTNTFVTQSNSTTAYGVSLTPVGFQFNFRPKKKVQPFLSANAGMIYFNKAVPDDRSPVRPNEFGRSFNFTLAGGGGVEIETEGGKSWTVGFKFHHISNASTGNINPGFDQNLFYVGYRFKKW